jgi:hypothetical protein
MPKKKTNYHSKGFVRRIAGSIFSSLGGEDLSSSAPANGMITAAGNDTKWRPRKKQFERLYGDNDDDELDSRTEDEYQNWTIRKVFSTESDAGEYKRDILYEQKRAAMKYHVKSSNKKRDLTSFSIKPPTKDTMAIRPTVTSGAFKKKLKTDMSDSTGAYAGGQKSFCKQADASVDAFGFHTHNNFASFHQDDESVSRHTMSSRQTASTKHSFPNPSHHTTSSDPSDFFSKETVKLTKNNLARMTAMSKSTNDRLDNNDDGRYPGEGKFYQFAIDEDRASTIVESNVGIPLDFGIKEEDEGEESMRSNDDDYSEDEEENTEYSVGFSSQKTKVQERTVPPSNDTKNNDFFFRDSERSHRQAGADSDAFDVFVPTKGDRKEDTFAFPEIANIECNLSDDPFREPPHDSALPPFRQASTHSLSYSPSPTNRKKALPTNASDRVIRDNRLPLSPLNNMMPSSSTRTLDLPPVSPPPKQSRKKPDPVAEWAPFHDQQNLPKPDPDAEFDKFELTEKSKSTWKNTRKRDLSLSSTFSAFATQFPERSSMKENQDATANQQGQRCMTKQMTWWDSSRSNGVKRNTGKGFNSDSEKESEGEDDDSFGSDGLWERSGGRVGLNKFSSGASIGGHVTSYGSKRVEVDDNKSVTSYGSTAGGSFTKPLGLPSNAIMASMLFRTHYGVDQQDVEKKIKAKEEENTKYKKARRDDIPDAVHADYDYMTNISSFSDETCHFQETWRKPSRDLLDYFSKDRKMQVDTGERLERQRAKAKAALFEA